MKQAAIVISVFVISLGANAQEFMKKVQLKEGSTNGITYQNLEISTLLQVYDEKSAPHLIGDVYLRIDINNKTIADFYVDHDSASKEYYTKAYQHYFLTFTNDSSKYLIIEQAEFGKVFALSSASGVAIGNKDDLIEIEIKDFVHESGYDAPIEDSEPSRFDDVNYTIKVKAKDVDQTVSFYSSEIEGDYSIDIGDYKIQILSDLYKDSSSHIEMMIIKKE